YTDCVVMLFYYVIVFFFFFQAEDGIRDRTVTGVQTCALPISVSRTCSVSHATSTRRCSTCSRRRPSRRTNRERTRLWATCTGRNATSTRRGRNTRGAIS